VDGWGGDWATPFLWCLVEGWWDRVAPRGDYIPGWAHPGKRVRWAHPSCKASAPFSTLRSSDPWSSCVQMPLRLSEVQAGVGVAEATHEQGWVESRRRVKVFCSSSAAALLHPLCICVSSSLPGSTSMGRNGVLSLLLSRCWWLVTDWFGWEREGRQ